MIQNPTNDKQQSVFSIQQKTENSLLITHHSVKPQRGFTLLIAVLISGILLSLGVAIFNIVSKEIVLSTSGRESQFAFYASDTGIECALYWDYQQDAFATTSALAEVSCADKDIPLTRDYDAVSDTYTTTFNFSLGTGLASPCSAVEVVREHNPTRTSVESSGFNTCVTTNPRRIERAIRVQY